MDSFRQNTAAIFEQHHLLKEVFAGYQFDQFPDRLRFLHRQLVSPNQDPECQALIYLEAGCHMFGLEQAIYLSHEGALEYLHCDLNQGQRGLQQGRAPLTELQNVVRASDLTLFAPVDGRLAVNLSQLTYNNGRVQAYIASPVLNELGPKGMLLFFSTEQGHKPFSAQDRETIILMAEGVARMNKISHINSGAASGSNAAELHDVEPELGFITPGVKSFKEYSYQAQLPQAHGVAGKVVEILQVRIGYDPLGIEHVASALNLSKRTLQRRLQQQNINFAQLRDQVRFHHAISYLVDQTHSIDRISSILDFSDRTSFTNAFKRWTGLSPSTFRKLFRDYV